MCQRGTFYLYKRGQALVGKGSGANNLTVIRFADEETDDPRVFHSLLFNHTQLPGIEEDSDAGRASN